MKKVIFIVLVVLLLGVFLFSGWKVITTLRDYKAGESFYEQMEDFVSVPEPEETKSKETVKAQEETVNEETRPGTGEDGVVWPEVDFAALHAINPDVVGWIYFPDTQMNYPVLQGDTNDEYIYTLMNGEFNNAGSIFLEAGIPSDFSAENSVVYGHNMVNGSMFAELAVGYRDQSYYEAHPYALLMTPQGNYYVRIFSGYVIDIWSDAWKSSFTGNEFAQWLQERVRLSCIETDVVPMPDDRILTFSTCTDESHDMRFILHGVLEKYNG